MRHEAEHATARVAGSGHVTLGAVGVGHAPIGAGGVAKDELAGRVESGEVGGRAGHESALAMGYGQFEPAETLEEDAVAWDRPQAHPAVHEPARAVVRQRRQRRAGRRVGEQQARLQEHLEAVADAEHEAAAIAKAQQGVGQPGADFEGEDAAAGDVVAVGKASRDAEDLEVVGRRRLLGECPHVHPPGEAAGAFEGERRFMVAVGAGGTQDEGAGREHVRSPLPARRGSGGRRRFVPRRHHSRRSPGRTPS